MLGLLRCAPLARDSADLMAGYRIFVPIAPDPQGATVIMSTFTTRAYRCRSCGSTSYQRLTHRGSDGAMRYSGVSQCSGCPVQFTHLHEWCERDASEGRVTDQGGRLGSGVRPDH